MAIDPNLDKYAGVLVGLAAGDALGAGYESRSPPTGPAEMIGGGLGGWKPGEWTDDTQMAICIAEEAATGRLDVAAVAERFLGWYREGPADVGIQTRSVLSRAAGPKDAGLKDAGLKHMVDAAADHFARHPNSSAGNGSLMRTAPVALACIGDDDALVETATAVSALTHADPLAAEACVLWCVAIDRAVREDRLDGVHDGVDLLPPDRRSYWLERIAEAKAGPPERFNPNGFVVAAFQAALSAVWNTPIPADLPCRHLEAALQTAVHIGNDTDTVAAIAGSLLGARWGASAAPARWKLIMNGWPGYTSRDLARLGILSGRKGATDHQGWPAADNLRSYYEGFRRVARSFVAPLAEDAGVLIAGVTGALDSGADITVSLCRMGRNELPPGRLAVDIALDDSSDPGSNPNLDFMLTDLARSIVAWRAQDRTVLIHCVQAQNRTPAVAAAYVAERFGVSGSQALARVRSQVPDPRRNPAFEAALQRLWP